MILVKFRSGQEEDSNSKQRTQQHWDGVKEEREDYQHIFHRHFYFFFLCNDGEVKARKSRVRKFDLSPCNFAAEKESGFMIYFEQEIYQYVL